MLTLSKLGSYREALGGIHLPALNLRFKGYAGNGILGSILIFVNNAFSLSFLYILLWIGG